MTLPPALYWVLPLVTGSAIAVLAAYVWLRRSVPGARPLFAALVCIAYWSIATGLEYRSQTLEAHVMWWRAEVPAFCSLPVCCLLLVCCYIGRPIRGWRIPVLFLMPAATLVMHYANGWFHLYWTRIWLDRSGPLPTLGRVYGPGFWTSASYSYLLLVLSFVLLLVHFVRRPDQRGPTLVLLGSATLPWFANIIYVFDWSPVAYLDLTPYAFAATGVGMFFALFRYRFQAIVPVAWKSVVQSMADGVLVVDMERRLADLNPSAEAILSCQKIDVVRRDAVEAFASYPELASYFERHGEQSGDIEFGGSIYAVTARDVRQGKRRVGRVITLRDVTRERQAARQLDHARLAAEAATTAKSRFLANMSHEIRTPMNGVVGMTGLLLASGLTADQSELAETVRESAEGLLAILDDVLDYSKIDAGKLDLEQVPFDAVSLADQVVRLLQPVAAKKGIEINLLVMPGVPRSILGDPTRLRQVILNLAGNAVKFTPAGRVHLSLEHLDIGAGRTQLTIEVGDTGVGIAPERISTLFQEFSQADSSIARTHGGTGLGLAISRRLVEQMGGSIRVESQLGRGSTFVVEVPFALCDPLSLPEMPSETHTGREEFPGCRVLLTEDNLVNQQVGLRVLRNMQCVVDLASNGHEAVRQAAANAYDLILMDVHMPEADGLEATREIRRRGIRTPIVALTASVMEDTRAACREAGMDGFITKPFRVEQVAAVLRSCLAATLR